MQEGREPQWRCLYFDVVGESMWTSPPKLPSFARALLQPDTPHNDMKCSVLALSLTVYQDLWGLLDISDMLPLFIRPGRAPISVLAAVASQLGGPEALRNLNMQKLARALHETLFVPRLNGVYELPEQIVTKNVGNIINALFTFDGRGTRNITRAMIKEGMIEVAIAPNFLRTSYIWRREHGDVVKEQFAMVWTEVLRREQLWLSGRGHLKTVMNLVYVLTKAQHFTLRTIIDSGIAIKEPAKNETISVLLPILLSNSMINKSDAREIVKRWPWVLEATLAIFDTEFPSVFSISDSPYYYSKDYQYMVILYLRNATQTIEGAYRILKTRNQALLKKVWRAASGATPSPALPLSSHEVDLVSLTLDLASNILSHYHDSSVLHALLDHSWLENELELNAHYVAVIQALCKAANTIENASAADQQLFTKALRRAIQLGETICDNIMRDMNKPMKRFRGAFTWPKHTHDANRSYYLDRGDTMAFHDQQRIIEQGRAVLKNVEVLLGASPGPSGSV